MWLSNYWRITIIYIWKRNLPLAFVPQHEMNPAQLNHFVSLQDCSLALSKQMASSLRLGPTLVVASVAWVHSPQVWCQRGQHKMCSDWLIKDPTSHTASLLDGVVNRGSYWHVIMWHFQSFCVWQLSALGQWGFTHSLKGIITAKSSHSLKHQAKNVTTTWAIGSDGALQVGH